MIISDNNLYYVGGVVRDEIMGIKSVDIDLCYQGNAIEFAKNLNLDIVRINPDFGTVKVNIDNSEVDIASTRIEKYPKRGHLPVVTNLGCSLKEDLKRRDFTVNAIAKRTTDSEYIDFYSGMDDIKNKILRVLHNDSFSDDPTRIIRGLKFSVRFGFELDENTLELQSEYLRNVNYDMSFFRLKKELVDAFMLNKQVVYEKFVGQKMYKLLGPAKYEYAYDIPIEESIRENDIKNPYIVYLGMFDLTNLPLTKSEKRVIEWAERLNNEKITKNTPVESILINELRRNYV